MSDHNPEMINSIAKAIALTINDSIVPDVTTQADLLSAIFTVLNMVLKRAQEMTDNSEDADTNAKEIARVLTDLLLRYGTTPTVMH